METPLYYEVHVSIKTPSNDVETALVAAVAERFKLRHSEIVGDEPDHILTVRLRSLQTATRYMTSVTMALGPQMVTRAKIEAAIVDFRAGDSWVAPIRDEEEPRPRFGHPNAPGERR